MKERYRELKYALIKYRTVIDENANHPVIIIDFKMMTREKAGDTAKEERNFSMALFNLKKYLAIIEEHRESGWNDQLFIPAKVDTGIEVLERTFFFTKGIELRAKINDARVLWKSLKSEGWKFVEEEK